MNQSILPAVTGGEFCHTSTVRPQNISLIPHREVPARSMIWSLLLGIALVSPAIIFAAFFPISADALPSTIRTLARPGFVILTSVIVGPMLEEIIYRGFLLQLTRRYAPGWAAVVLSSTIFAATHLMKGAGITLVAFAMGCLFSWMVVRTRSLYPGLLCHVAFNFAGLCLQRVSGLDETIFAYAPGATISHPLTELFPAWWIVLTIIVAAISFIMLKREFTRSRKTIGDVSSVS